MELFPVIMLIASLVYGGVMFMKVRRTRRARRRRARGLCAHCAYDLAGVHSGMCPECGAPFVPR